MIYPIPASAACAALGQHPDISPEQLQAFCLHGTPLPTVDSPAGSLPWWGQQVEPALLAAMQAACPGSQLIRLSSVPTAVIGETTLHEDAPGRGVVVRDYIFSAHPDAVLLMPDGTLHVADAKMSAAWRSWAAYEEGEHRELTPVKVLVQLLVQHRLLSQYADFSPIAFVPLLLCGRFELRRIDLAACGQLLDEVTAWHAEHVLFASPLSFIGEGEASIPTAVKGTYLDTPEACAAADAYLEAARRAEAFAREKEASKLDLLRVMGSASAVRRDGRSIVTRDARNALRAGAKE